MSKSLRWSLIFGALFTLAVTIYLYALGMWLEAISFSGVASIILWFMLRIIEKATMTPVEPDDEGEDDTK